DRDGTGLVLDKIRGRFPWLELIWADGGYNAWQVGGCGSKGAAAAHRDRQAERRHEELRRPAASLGGRTHLILDRMNRRLAKDFENLAETLATFGTVASIALRQLARS